MPYDKCIWCDKSMKEADVPFCCESHMQSCDAAGAEADLELEMERDERMRDPNEGCWSYSW